MPIFVFGAAGSIGFTSTTFGTAKQIVARCLGSQDNSDVVGAGDAIHMAIDKLNETEWDYLTVRGSDIPVVAGTATYSLPTPIKKPISLRLTDHPLGYIRRSDYDKTVWTQLSDRVTNYTMFNSALGGKLELIPTPSSGGTMEIRYYRPVQKPSDNSEKLDILDWMERYLILEAQAHILAEQGENLAKAQFMQAKADRALLALQGSDRTAAPDEDQTFIPFAAWGNKAYPIDHAQTWIQETDI